ncbi:MAG: glyoxylase family protein [Actinomycetota bacterium]|nr:glyoxylase family protein [Actinomycetota bacterium]
MIFGEIETGLVVRLNVADVEVSATWYESKLGMAPDHRFDAPHWRQFNLNGVVGAAVGLSQDQPVGNGGSVVTFVVSSIERARDELMKEGITVGPIENPGHGVQLALFQDLDGNNLALRQNPGSHPSPRQIGDIS